MPSCNDLKGKKLMVLAGSFNMVDLIRRAKELGIYTITTDYYNAYDSPAKRIADEAWDISWSDIDKLETKCREAGVNGVITGYSEFTVENMIKLCKRLDLPCYCTDAQLDITRNKDLFKKTCQKYNVPTIKEYASADDVKNFPVIVKPVDRGGSIGISVANDAEELRVAVDYALEKSVCKKIIIEDYISNGIKVDVYYGIINGEVTLLTTSDTILAEGNSSKSGFNRVIQNGWVAPSKYHDLISSELDESFKKMIKGMGVKYGYFFFSGFAVEENDVPSFSFFETGFRLSGGHIYRYLQKLGFIDIQDIFIKNALLGDKYNETIGSDKVNGLKTLIVNYYAKKGILKSIEGTDIITNMPDCGYSIILDRVGSECTENAAILNKLYMCHFYNTSIDQLSEDADNANHAFVALDQNGTDMVFERINPQIIKYWYEK